MSALLRRILVPLVALSTVTAILVVGGDRIDRMRVEPAADLSQFDPGNIISDEVFFAGGALSASEIQAFLQARNGDCVAGPDGTPCLKDFRQDTTTRPVDAYCNGYTAAGGETAAAIIAKVAVSCGINPKVLLVMLQKEQSLVTGTGSALYATRYQKAMGFACPDTAPCNTAYYGFQNQVFSAARQYKRYTANAQNYTYRAGQSVPVYWHPNTAACGSAPVHIRNQATANLYIYTPYQPNARALSAGYGVGDSCSSYGNRNFWLYFTDWFGSTQSDAITKASPKGVVDTLTMTRSGFTATGWSFDPDAPDSPVTVRATVDGNPVASASAGQSRPDVGRVYGVGASHGFTVSGLLSQGTHRVCVVADNLHGQGIQTQLGCKLFEFTDRRPVLSVDALREQADGSIAVSGWIFDPDGNAPQVHVYDNGVGRALTPSVPRPDVQNVHPAAGPTSGFSVTLPAAPGRREVCLFAVDTVAAGNNWLAVCEPFQYKAPIGSVDQISETAAGTLRIRGWALDPSVPTEPIAVHVYVDGRGVALTANGAREDVGRVHPGTGSSHGFDTEVPVTAGRHDVCVFYINAGIAGSNSWVCRTVDLPYVAPQGVVDQVRPLGDGQVAVQGWAFDRSSPTTSVSMHYYVDGRFAGAGVASAARDDVARAFPGVGSAHGFQTTLTVPRGRHDVCTFALNVGVGGPNTLLNCTVFTH